MRAQQLAWPIVGAVGGLVVGGLVGLVAGAVVASGAVWARDGVIIAAMSTSLAIAIVTLAEAGSDADATRVFPTLRPTAHQVGVVSALVWIAAGAVIWREFGRRDAVMVPETGGARAVLPLVILVSAAVVGTLLVID